MPKFLLIDIKTNLVKLYMGILILLFGGMFIFGVSNLNHERVTQYIELIFTILGILLCTAIYSVDQNKKSKLTISAKCHDYQFVFMLRLVITIIYILFLITINLFIFYLFNSNIIVLRDMFIALTSTLFIGSICLLTSILSGNTLNGLMFGLVYFLFCLGFRNLGFMYLFSETFNFPFYIKIFQFLLGIVLLILSYTIIKKVQN